MSTATEQITVIPYSPNEHYPIVRAWWEARGYQTPPAPDLLRHGGMATLDNGDPVAAYFIYFSLGCPVAHTQYAVSHPENDGVTTKRALVEIMEYFSEICRKNDYRIMLTHCSARLAKHIGKIGYHVADENAASCIKIIEGVDSW